MVTSTMNSSKNVRKCLQTCDPAQTWDPSAGIASHLRAQTVRQQVEIGGTSATYITQSVDQQRYLSSHQLSVGCSLQIGDIGTDSPVHENDVIVVL